MNFNILFIDDEKDILEAYKRLLKGGTNESSELDDLLSELGGSDESTKNKFNFDEKYKYFSASQGQDGVDIIRQQKEKGDPISVCLVDFRMPPGINGKDTIKKIREIDKNVEIVLVTAYSDIDLEEIVEEVGTPEKLLFLKKPFDNKEVKQLILNLTNKYFDARIRESFVSNVTHELKTPLASILGFTQLMAEDELSEDHKEYVATILDSALLMKEQVDDLLAVAHFENRGQTLNTERVKVSSVVSEIQKMMEPLFKNSSVEFRVSSELDFELDIDKNKFKQCLINLLTNSRKFTEEGFVELKVHQDGEGLVFEVTDSGIGMPTEKLDRIFDKFFRVEDVHHNTPGLGLGLSIVKRIIDAHDMSIHVESEVGKGSKFTIKAKIAKSLGAVA